MPGQGVQGGIVEYFSPGDRTTVVSSGSVSGGNVVTLIAEKKAQVATAADVPYGVALHDAANGEDLAVAHVGVWPLKASATLATAGIFVNTAAAGAVAAASTTTGTNLLVGQALAPINQNAVGPVRLKL